MATFKHIVPSNDTPGSDSGVVAKWRRRAKNSIALIFSLEVCENRSDLARALPPTFSPDRRGRWMTLPDGRPTIPLVLPRGPHSHHTATFLTPTHFQWASKKASGYITGFSEPWQLYTQKPICIPRAHLPVAKSTISSHAAAATVCCLCGEHWMFGKTRIEW